MLNKKLNKTANDLKKLQKLLLTIPHGKITTYGLLAKAMGIPKKSRYVGYLLKSNPCPDKYPCYKVIKSNGELGGYSGPHFGPLRRNSSEASEASDGEKEKIRRLSKDGVIIESGRVKNFEAILEKFTV